MITLDDQGTMHVRIGIDGTQIARSESQHERFINSCLVILQGMNESHMSNSTLHNIILGSFTSSDSKNSIITHISDIMVNINEATKGLLEGSGSEIEIKNLKKIKMNLLSDGKLIALMGQRTLASGNQDRNNLYSSTESVKLARAIYPDTGELLFALSCSRSIEWEKTIASMEDMNPGVAKMWNVNMNISKKWYEIMGFDYDDMVQEALHRDGRNAIVVIEFGVQHAALCGCEDKLLSHWTKNCKISMSNGSYVIFNDGQSVQGRTRVGGASRLVSHPDFIGPAFVASLTKLQRE